MSRSIVDFIVLVAVILLGMEVITIGYLGQQLT